MQSRLQILDVLRGAAILGTLGTNIWLFANAGNLGALFGQNSYSSQIEHALQQATLFLTNGKFLGMLTILFGIGLELQYQSAKRHNTAFLPAYLWRSTILFLDGLLHFIFVIEFDILMGYALTAMVVAWLVTKGERLIHFAMWAAFGIHLLMAIAVTIGLNSQDFGNLEEISRVYLGGTYLEGLQYRLQNFWSLRLEPIFVIPLSAGLFLFGVRLFRVGGLTELQTLRRFMFWGLGLGLPLNALSFLPELGLDIMVRYVFAPILSLGYIGLIGYGFQRGWLELIKNSLATIGRMALSNYMLQGIFASVLFYGWGIGLARQPNAFVALAAWLGIGTALVVLSQLWLKHFSNGPFETIWKFLSELPFKTKGNTTKT